MPLKDQRHLQKIKNKGGGAVENTRKNIIITDRYNIDKKWQIIKLKGGYYLKQFIKNKQFGRGARISKKRIEKILETKIEF